MPFTCDAVSGSDAIDCCCCSGGPYLKLQSSPVVVTSADTSRIAVQTAAAAADDSSASLAGGDVICPSDYHLVAAAYDVIEIVYNSVNARDVDVNGFN
jgi:hypothetical protein